MEGGQWIISLAEGGTQEFWIWTDNNEMWLKII
jgi:hypothetical protein